MGTDHTGHYDLVFYPNKTILSDNNMVRFSCCYHINLLISLYAKKFSINCLIQVSFSRKSAGAEFIFGRPGTKIFPDNKMILSLATSMEAGGQGQRN